MPSGLWTPFPIVQGELPSQVRLESTAVQNSPVVLADCVLPAEVRARPHVRFAMPSAASLSVLEHVVEEDDDAESVTSNPPIVDKTVVRSANIIHENYPESRPHCRLSPAASPALSSGPLSWGGWGFELCLGHPPGSLCATIFAVCWV